MDLGGHDGAEISMPMPMPMSTSSFIHESSTNLLINNVNAGPLHIEEEQIKSKKTVRYRECMKNHAASMGGNATDGCGEFMPCGEEGTLEALKCSACECHRNFHRREVEGEPSCDCFRIRDQLNRKRSGVLVSSRAQGTAALAAPDPFAFPPNNLLPRLPPQAIMSYSTGPSESDELEGTFLSRPAILKKRFRTKFTQDQKDRMLDFAEKVGWRIQKHDEQAVQQFCQDVGVKRRVLKVWMHNNKNTLGKKTD